MSSYVELHAHSAFSFLDGTAQPEELVVAALERGHSAMALTDHDTVSGSMEFAQAAEALGLRAIHGAEVSVRDEGAPASPQLEPDPARPRTVLRGAVWEPPSLRHVTLLVRDAVGWRNLCRLLTRAHAHTRDATRRRAIAPSVTLTDLAQHAEGLVCLSGCARQGIRDEPGLRRLRAAFGSEGLRVELQRPFARHDRAQNRGLEELARRLGVACVATGDVHAHTRERALLQDAFVAIREHTTLDASEPVRRGNHAHVLTTPEAMAARFADHPDAVAETARLAEELTFDLTADLGYRYPYAEDAGGAQKLRGTCLAAFDSRYPPGHRRREEAIGRLEEELRLIDGLGLSGFFTLHHEILEMAREIAVEVRGTGTARSLLPPGRGRGSSVSSIVCYLTGLSHIDPIENALFLGRFLNEEITALPDIDLDFPRDIRAELIPRIHEKFGSEHSALVAAFPTFRAKGAIRELGKALGLPPGEIERVARASEGFAAFKVEEDVQRALGGGREKLGRWEWLVRLAEESHGLPRHLSQHSGGMIVATRSLVDCCAVVPAAMEGRQMVMWDKDSCADAGFLKIDLLGLGMLSAAERCVELIGRQRDEFVDLSRIPYDDPEVYEAIQRGETTGVFQIESRAQMASLLRTRPETLDDLTIQVAIVRPGPIQGGAVNPYIARKQAMREDPDYVVPYEHPALREILADTLGTIIFQDQVIEVATGFAGFSPGEAEGLRRAMSRKRSETAIRAYHERFVEGAMRTHGAPAEVARRVYDMIVGFSGFGFPKAHGAAFGLLAYQSTWLRVHYGPEFLSALLDEQPMGFYPPDALIHEAQRRGIAVVPPDVNASGVGCDVTADGAVRVGLGYVMGVRADEVEALVAAREADGPFVSVEDLAARAGAGRMSLGKLAWSGACDGLVASEVPLAGHRRRAALWRLGAAAPGIRVRVRGAGPGRTVEAGTQLALPLPLPEAPALPALGAWDAMIADYRTTGITTTTHPITLLRGVLDEQGAVGTARFGELRHGQRVRVGGLVVARQRPGTAKGIVFMLLEDEAGTINLIVSPELYDRDRLVVRTEPLVVADGVFERHPAAGGQVNVVVRSIWALEAPDKPLAAIKDFSPLDLAELERATNEDRDRGAARRAGGYGDGGRRRGLVAIDADELDEPADAGYDDAGQLAPTGTDGGDFRAVAPPVMSFAQGRRR